MHYSNELSVTGDLINLVLLMCWKLGRHATTLADALESPFSKGRKDLRLSKCRIRMHFWKLSNNDGRIIE
jgi:hypothetical protein